MADEEQDLDVCDPADDDFNDVHDEAVVDAVDLEQSADGEHQRLRIRIPDVYSQLTLGYALNNDDDQGYAFRGFGVDTEGHVFLNAGLHGGQGTESAVVQAKKSVTLNSVEANVFMQAHGTAVITGYSGAFMGAASDIVIASSPNIPSTNEIKIEGTTIGADPVPPQNLDAVPNELAAISLDYSKWQLFASGLDFALDTASLVADLAGERNLHSIWQLTAWGLRSYMGAWGGGWFSPADAFKAPATVSAEGGGGGAVTIHGSSGVCIGTSLSLDLFSAIGTSIVSGVGVGTLAPFVGSTGLEVELMGLKSAGVTGLFGVQIGSPKGDVELESRGGSVNVRGKSVQIGTSSGPGGQDDTEDVLVRSSKNLSLATLGRAHLQGEEYVRVRSPKSVELSGDVEATVWSEKVSYMYGGKQALMYGHEDVLIRNEKFQLSMDGSDLYFGLSSANFTETKPPKAPSITALQDECMVAVMSAEGLAAKRELGKFYRDKIFTILFDYANEMEDWRNNRKIAQQISKKARTGISIGSSKMELFVEGHKLTIDSSSFKSGSHLKVKK